MTLRMFTRPFFLTVFLLMLLFLLLLMYIMYINVYNVYCILYIQDDAWDVYTAIDSGSCASSGGNGNISITLFSLLFFNCGKELDQKLHVDVPQVVEV